MQVRFTLEAISKNDMADRLKVVETGEDAYSLIDPVNYPNSDTFLSRDIPGILDFLVMVNGDRYSYEVTPIIVKG